MKPAYVTKEKNKGFTIIETLVAITILMIAIAGPLTIAQKGLMAAIYAKDQVTASFLAQDLMEDIKNDIRNGWTTGPAKCSNNPPAPLLPQPRFSRTCNITTFVNNPNEITVTVTVTWSTGTISNSVVLANEMFNVSL